MDEEISMVGAGKENRDDLVRWEMCCQSESSGIENLRSKNVLLLAKRLWWLFA